MKPFILVLTLALFLSACQQQKKQLKEGEYIIYGTVEGQDTGEFYLASFEEEGTIDTIRFKGGSFEMTGKIPSKAMQVGVFRKSNGSNADSNQITMYLEPGEMQLSLVWEAFNQSTLKGSETQRLSKTHRQKVNKIMTGYDEKMKLKDSLFAELQKQEQAGAPQGMLDSLKKAHKTLERTGKQMQLDQQKANVELIQKNPSNQLSLELLAAESPFLPVAQLEALHNGLSSDLKDTEMGKRVVEIIAYKKKGMVGSQATAFSTVDIHGNPLALSDFKGKYLLIDFWGSWCGPCRQSHPHLIELYNKYHNQGLEILGAAADDRDPEAWRKAVKEDKIGMWHHVLVGEGEKSVQAGYAVGVYPTKILVNPEGVIIGRFEDIGKEKDMDKMVKDIFGS